jgi:hypothetical protein
MARRSSATESPVPERLADDYATGAIATDEEAGARQSRKFFTSMPGRKSWIIKTILMKRPPC